MRTIATAGHVDHGKSSLVLALTGTDPDRFAEEKARGLTIDLGFAFTTLASGTEIGFVDVPGHARFIKNMLAGVGAVDVALIVVAAGEGWMPQSEEHLQILEVLGVEHAMVAVTKADAVEPGAVDLAVLAVEDRLAASLLCGSPVVVCDSISGRGLDDVRATLDRVLAEAPSAIDRDRPRLWVDRVFAARGAGTVVTGTLTGGSLAIDDEVEVARSGERVRVRGIETAHRHVDRVEPGGRVALNLAGIDHRSLGRGDALVRPTQWSRTTTVDVEMLLLVGDDLDGRAPLHASVGSGEHEVRLRPLGTDGRFARIRFDTAAPLPLAPGDRLVLRDSGRIRTVAGAVVLDAEPTTTPADAPAVLALDLGPRVVAGHGWIATTDFPRLSGLAVGEATALAASMVASEVAEVVGGWLVGPERLADVRARAAARVRAHHADHPNDAGMELGVLAAAVEVAADQLRAGLEGDAELAVVRGVVRDVERSTRLADSDAARTLIAALDAEPFSPPAPSDIGLARALVRDGDLVDVDGIVFTRAAVDRARALIATAVSGQATLTIAEAREILGTSRKFVVPLLTRFDTEGVTRRRGDVRVAGPRAASVREPEGAPPAS